MTSYQDIGIGTFSRLSSDVLVDVCVLMNSFCELSIVRCLIFFRSFPVGFF